MHKPSKTREHRRHDDAIWICKLCIAGLALTTLGRCEFPPPEPQPTAQVKQMDDADRATAQSDIAIERRLATRTRYAGQSATECKDCDEPIPEQRRKAIAGCTRCTGCQNAAEKRGQA